MSGDTTDSVDGLGDPSGGDDNKAPEHGPWARLRELLAHPTVPVATTLSLLMLMAELIPGSRETLRYVRDEMLTAGGILRWPGSQLVHLGWSHLALNLAGLWLVVAFLARSVDRSGFLIACALSGLGVVLGLLLASPEVGWYVGASGMLHGILIAGLLAGRGLRGWERWGLLIGVIIKLIWEQSYGPVPGSADAAGGPVVVDAHLYGALGGALAAAISLTLDRAQERG